MCGIAGIIKLSASINELNTKIQKMQSTLVHRGPDDEGIYLDHTHPLIFGHRRLAIIDPEQGKQPMSSVDGRFTIVFNGAIYNYIELSKQLIKLGHPIHSHSDTEVLLYAYREWGEQCLDHLIGMFAFAIWDQDKQIVFCARDRVGIKPFYYYFDEQQFIFASEIKAILAEGSIAPQMNPDGLSEYLTFQFCLGEKTLFKDIVKLEPGHYLTIQIKPTYLTRHIKSYWDLAYNIDSSLSENDYIDKLDALIRDSVRMHLRSDVPLGSHLSGGLDSSVVVSYASPQLSRPLKTFTGAFAYGPEFDETDYAKLVAKHAGADYHEIYIPETEFSTVLPELIYRMDEPVAGPGLIPQFYVSKLAAEHVKVVLGGQGGDEIFIGYARYMIAYLEKSLYNAIYTDRGDDQDMISLTSMIPHLPLLQQYQPMLQKFWSNGLFEPQDKRYFNLIDRRDSLSRLMSEDALKTNHCPFSAFQTIFNREGLGSFINKMLYFDIKASLPALLQVEDRTSMAASIESRVPLLDHRIIELMARIPANIKFSGGRMKHIFKEATRNIIPKAIIERKDKMGFNTPLNQWINGSAKDFVYDLLTSQRAHERGLYNMKNLISYIENPNSHTRTTWGILCLELWHTVFIDQNNA